ncbi:MAG TPA: ABC transporter permease [Gaiellaceae bacterium]|nr:ABC transporter permease [Gaiellaceae bacterium]
MRRQRGVPPLVRFLLKRLAALAALLVALSFGIFALLYLSPGSVISALLGNRPRTTLLVHQLEVEYHLDQSFLAQYWFWLRGAVHLHFGESTLTGLPVTTLIGKNYGATAFLVVYTFLLTVIIGVVLGVLAAVRRRSLYDRLIVGTSVFAASMPAFVTAVLLLYVFSVRFSWFPAFGPGTGFLDRLWHLTLPALALALTISAWLLKLTRATMIEVLDQEYVTFARARGVPRGAVLLTYAFRNACIPVLTAAGLILGGLVTGAVLVEYTFGLPGLGSLLVSSVEDKDVPVVQCLALLAAAIVLLANLAADVLYVLLDPRIRRQRGFL